MDLPDCDPVRLDRTYRQFAAVNTLFSGWRRLYRTEIRPLLSPGTATTLLDVGSGGGDLPVALARWATRDNARLDITGIDPDSRAHRFAASRASVPGVRFREAGTKDLVREGQRFDIVLSNHVLHHLQPSELQDFLAETATLGRTVLHNDLRRSPAAYALFAVAALPFRGSFIRADGLTSIRRSYTPAELAAVAPAGWQTRPGPAFHQLLVRWPESPHA